jgi:uncharacterized membrane protein
MVISYFIVEHMPAANVVIYGLGYAHYALGLKYSKRGVANAWTKPRSKAIVLGALITSFLLAGMPMVITGIIVYFGFHHAISEAYFQQDSQKVRTAHGFLVLGTYLAIIASNIPQIPHLVEVGWGLTAASVVVLLTVLRNEPNRDQINPIKRFPWLVVGPLFLVSSIWFPVNWKTLTLFHFIFWGALPLLRPGLIQGVALKRYWTETALTNAGCVALVLLLYRYGTNAGNQLPYLVMTQLFFAWSYLHITWSFVVSGANPPWVKRLVGAA